MTVVRYYNSSENAIWQCFRVVGTYNSHRDGGSGSRLFAYFFFGRKSRASPASPDSKQEIFGLQDDSGYAKDREISPLRSR